MRISDWSSDVCSSDLQDFGIAVGQLADDLPHRLGVYRRSPGDQAFAEGAHPMMILIQRLPARQSAPGYHLMRSEEHTSELQSLMRISYAVFCLKKKRYTKTINSMAIDTVSQTDTLKH